MIWLANLMFNGFQAALLVLAAPLVRGLIGRAKARIQRRQGASIWRPYYDLIKLFGKEDLVPPSASAVFRLAPVILFAGVVTAAAFVPVMHPSALLGARGDFIVVVYLLALGRFFLVLGAMDGGSAFGGMGASREALVSTLAEAPLMLGLFAVAISSRSQHIAGIVEWTLRQNVFNISAVHVLALAALAFVTVAETGRIPVDNPTTHLELTMIHEAMVLEYSGPSLAWIEWASAVKLHLLLALLIALFAPWGMSAGEPGGLPAGPAGLTLSGAGLALGAYLLKLLVLVGVVAAVESSVAKMRMYLVPDFLGVATALSILAVIFTMLGRR